MSNSIVRPYYVYVLIDNRSNNNEIFYVGKGTGNRANEHLKEDGETEKIGRIKDIENSNNKVVVRVIGRYKTEDEAFAVESTLIHFVYGKGNLTNVQSGHGSEFIRLYNNFDEKEILDEGLISEKAGNFSKIYRTKREIHSIIKFMEEVKKYLEKELDGITFSDINTEMAKETSISYSINEKIKVVVSTGNSARKKLNFQLFSYSNSAENKILLRTICDETDFELLSNGKYAREKNFQLTDREIIKDIILKTNKLLKNFVFKH